uniref:ATP synthase complex subunit 8 n=1 Tax=Nabis ferus TaxID=347965 RepID=A0A7D5JTK0_9HEMI|nr:ATP synthase F0 subunit 8 [Nabis ferus]QLF99789.1 ATP synthase F0 subunit 8 [Nabis ferus]
MPQMAPIWWMTMFMLFIIILLSVMIINYFYIKYNNYLKPTINYISTNINWKW